MDAETQARAAEGGAKHGDTIQKKIGEHENISDVRQGFVPGCF